MAAAPRKKQAIIETAAEFLRRNGATRLTIEGIAERVPVSKVTVYNHFGDRESLVRAAMFHILEGEFTRIKAMCDGAGGAVGALRSLLSADELARANSVYSREFLLDLTANQPELLAEVLAYTQERYIPFFEDLVFEGQRQGYLRKDVSPHLITMYLMAIKSYCSRPEVLQEILDSQSMQEQLSSLFLHGVVRAEG